MLGSDNVLRDLGFPEGEAQNLWLRGDLVIHIRKVIDKLGITQAEAVKRAGITQPRMNDLVKNRTHTLAQRTGKGAHPVSRPRPPHG